MLLNKKNIIIKSIPILFFALLSSGVAHGQKLAVKNNALYDIALVPNIGMEVALTKQLTIDVGLNYNPFRFNDEKQWRHWLLQPEVRYWFCQKFEGHFVGVHLLGGTYNMQNVRYPFGYFKPLRTARFQGWYWGAGVSYGYNWILSNHWGVETTVGVGYIRAYYDKYNCSECCPIEDKGYRNYIGPTKLGVTFAYYFLKDKK